MSSRLPKSSVSTLAPEWKTSLARITPSASAPTSTSAVKLEYSSRRRRDEPRNGEGEDARRSESAEEAARSSRPSATTRPGNAAAAIACP